MEDKEIKLTKEQLEAGNERAKEDLGIKCPHCGSTNIIPFHSPTKGTAYLCCDCYYSISKKEIKKNKEEK